MCPYDQSALQMLRIDGVWLSTEALDMRAGMDTLLTKVVLVFGAAQPVTDRHIGSNRCLGAPTHAQESLDPRATTA